MNIIPFEDRVVILQDEAEKQTEAGLFIPDTAQKKPSKGTVISVGPGKADKGAPVGYMLNDTFFHSLDGKEIKSEDRIVPVYTMNIKEGDKVLFAKFAGVPFPIDGVEHLVVRVSDLIARV